MDIEAARQGAWSLVLEGRVDRIGKVFSGYLLGKLDGQR